VFSVLLVFSFFSFSFSAERGGAAVRNPVDKGIFDSCDATAKILLKCMISTNCEKIADDLKLALTKVTVYKDSEKQLLVSDCYTECEKGMRIREQGISLQSAVNGEYNALMQRCIGYMKSLVKEGE